MRAPNFLPLRFGEKLLPAGACARLRIDKIAHHPYPTRMAAENSVFATKLYLAEKKRCLEARLRTLAGWQPHGPGCEASHGQAAATETRAQQAAFLDLIETANLSASVLS
jgi:hypothetical protein